MGKNKGVPLRQKINGAATIWGLQEGRKGTSLISPRAAPTPPGKRREQKWGTRST
jgi:hypothetical protein